MQRYFLKQPIADDIVLTDEQDVFKHFGKVLRARVGSQAEFVSQDQEVVVGEVVAITPTEMTLKVVSRLTENVELPVQVTVIVSPLKNDRSDWFVQKATELGVHRIIFTTMTRTVADWRKQQLKKAMRLEKIAQAATEQSHRLMIPTIDFFIVVRSLVVTQASWDSRLGRICARGRSGDACSSRQALTSGGDTGPGVWA